MGKKLLVADDSVTIQKVIKLALSSEGYNILAVSEGIEAIRAIQEERPDVVLIDVALPGADAYAVKKAINADPKLASIGFILMASAFERVDEALSDEVKFSGRLIKPFDPSHLRKAVADLMVNPGPPAPPVEVEDLLSPEPEPISEPEPMIELSPSLIVPPPPPLAPPTPSVIMETEELTPTKPLESYPVMEEQVVPQTRADDFTPVTDMQPIIEEEQSEQSNLENDIKDLTESTIKMSGLDEFQWSLDDSRKMKDPQPKPPAPEPEQERTTEIKRISSSGGAASISKSGMISIPSRPIDDGGSTFPIDVAAEDVGLSKVHKKPTMPPLGSNIVSGREFNVAQIEIPAEAGMKKQNQNQSQSQAPSGASVAPPISRAEIEALIRKDMAQAIEKIARETVVQMAEQIIRKEIEKILSEN